MKVSVNISENSVDEQKLGASTFEWKKYISVKLGTVKSYAQIQQRHL